MTEELTANTAKQLNVKDQNLPERQRKKHSINKSLQLQQKCLRYKKHKLSLVVKRVKYLN